MDIAKAFVSALIGAFVGVVSAMLIASLFEPKAFKLSVAVGIACGAATANTIRAWRQVSPEKSAWIVGCCVGWGAVIGTWFAGPG